MTLALDSDPAILTPQFRRQASVSGDCVEQMLTPSGDLEFHSESRLELVNGWNLIRTAFVEVVEFEDGSRYEKHTVHDALQAFPDDTLWYLESL